ncbi:RidA family protein [Mesorhizobium sp. M0074]|uniref:RidA family protein n=1 Tax=Mesorhizobium sp. M0074 TaxID=2956869 RepID=UPI00333C7D05
MKKEVIEVPVMSAKVQALGLPCTTAVRVNGFVFISATPPVDMVTGELVRGDIETQTEASLKALKHCLEAAGTSLDYVVMVRIYARTHAPSARARSCGTTWILRQGQGAELTGATAL